MTVQELKREADKLGYRIQKKPDKIPLLPCTCGTEVRETDDLYLSPYGVRYKCRNCGKSPDYTKGYKKARVKWNDMIRRS